LGYDAHSNTNLNSFFVVHGRKKLLYLSQLILTGTYCSFDPMSSTCFNEIGESCNITTWGLTWRGWCSAWCGCYACPEMVPTTDSHIGRWNPLWGADLEDPVHLWKKGI